jgi:hypothetical protein
MRSFSRQPRKRHRPNWALVAFLALTLVSAACGDTELSEEEQLQQEQEDTDRYLRPDPPPEGFSHLDLAGNQVTIHDDHVRVEPPGDLSAVPAANAFEVEGDTQFNEEVPNSIAVVDNDVENGCDPLQENFGDAEEMVTLEAVVSDRLSTFRYVESVAARYALDRALDMGCAWADAAEREVQRAWVGTITSAEVEALMTADR